MRIMIVDDHPMVRKGISSVLSCEDDVKEIKEASNVSEAMHILSLYGPDVAIVDLKLGREDGLEIVNRAKKKDYPTKFIVLTSSGLKEDFRRAQEAGVDGYILKDAFTEDIIYAFHVVNKGNKYVDPQILKYDNGQKEDDGIEQLTLREKDILELLGKGLSNNQIADKLFISENTVKKHISNVLLKLGLERRTQAAIYVNGANYFDH